MFRAAGCTSFQKQDHAEPDVPFDAFLDDTKRT
jgi:hypothetical protein